MQTKKRKIAKVEWYDAQQAQCDQEFIETMQNMETGKELLAINTTYGELINTIEDVVVVIHEGSTSSKNDYTVIPRGWVKKITTLRGTKK